jgi:hypothetical protein
LRAEGAGAHRLTGTADGQDTFVKVVKLVVSTGKWFWDVLPDLSSSLRANERLLLRRVGDRQQQTTLAQGKWIALLIHCLVVLGSAVWPEVIRMHAGG